MLEEKKDLIFFETEKLFEEDIINKFDEMLYWQLINFPTEMIPMMDSTVTEVYKDLIKQRYKDADKDELQVSIRVRICNLTKKSQKITYRLGDVSISTVMFIE